MPNYDAPVQVQHGCATEPNRLRNILDETQVMLVEAYSFAETISMIIEPEPGDLKNQLADADNESLMGKALVLRGMAGHLRRTLADVRDKL